MAFGWGPRHIWLQNTLQGPWPHYMMLEVVLGRPLDTFFWALTIPWSRLLDHVWSGPKRWNEAWVLKLRTLTTIDNFHSIMVENPAWIEIRWNSIWLRARSRMLEGPWPHYMMLEVCWDGRFWTISFGLSQFHGHGSWLVCEPEVLKLLSQLVACWNREFPYSFHEQSTLSVNNNQLTPWLPSLTSYSLAGPVKVVIILNTKKLSGAVKSAREYTSEHLCIPYVREEPAVSCRWTGWVCKITGWSWRL